MHNTNIIKNVLNTSTQDIAMNNEVLTMNEIQSKIDFLRNLKSLRMGLNGVDKNLNGYGYKYQDFNEIIRTIKQVIKDNNLDIDFMQCPTIKSFDGNLVDVITTTFYSTKTGYEHSFDTRMCVEEIKSLEIKSKMTLPQLVGTNITYFKRYALVAYLSIESEVDNDASNLEPIEEDTKEQNNNLNFKQVNVMQKDARYSNVTDSEMNNVMTNHNKISNSVINDKVKKNNQSTNTMVINKERVNSIKFNGYKNMLIAARSMHNYVKNKPFDSIEQINSYLSDIETGNDVKLLNHFSKRRGLKSIKYWINLIRNYISSNTTLKNKLDQFNAFVAFKGHLYQGSTIKLFSFLSGEIELQCLFENYRAAS